MSPERLAALTAKLQELPDADLAVVEQLVAMLPSSKLAAELAALDGAQAERGGAGRGGRPAEGSGVHARAAVLRMVRLLQRTSRP